MEILIWFYIALIALVMPQITSYRSYSNYKEFYKNIDTLKPKSKGEVLEAEYAIWNRPINWKVDNFKGAAYYPDNKNEVTLFKGKSEVIAVNAFGVFVPLTNKWHNKVLKDIEEKSV